MRKKEITINGKNYVLELTRESIKWLESMGFEIENFGKKPLTYFDLLWTSLFIANHKDVNPNLAIKLLETYEKEGKKANELVKFAIEEYESFMNALTDTSSNSTSENIETITIQ